MNIDAYTKGRRLGKKKKGRKEKERENIQLLQSNSTQLSRRYISGRRIAPTSPKGGAAPSPGARCTGVLACIARNLPRTYTDVTMSFFFEGDCSVCLYIVGARNTTGHPVWHVHSVQPRWNRRLKRRSESQNQPLLCDRESRLKE